MVNSASKKAPTWKRKKFLTLDKAMSYEFFYGSVLPLDKPWKSPLKWKLIDASQIEVSAESFESIE